MRIATLLALTLVLISGCRNYAVHVYSGVDPKIKPNRSDSIYLARPTDASIRERQTEALIRTELEKNGFTLAHDPSAAKWILAFAVNRATYVVGAESSSTGLAMPLFGTAIAIGHANTTYKQQTNVEIFMHLFSAADIGKDKPAAFWEGSMIAAENIYRVYPNASIKVLLDKFSQNHDRRVNVNKAYQRSVN